MKNGRQQAKDISDERTLAAVEATRQEWGPSMLWDIQSELKEFPPKVVLAKLRSLKRRGKVDGCTCGCRGDFRVLAK